jgi:hypothetical protein
VRAKLTRMHWGKEFDAILGNIAAAAAAADMPKNG